MDMALLDIAERLALEFPEAPTSTVVLILTECADRYPGTDPMFLEQAARAQLRRSTGEP